MDGSVEPFSAAVHFKFLHMGEVQLLNQVFYKILRVEVQQIKTCEGGGRHVLQCQRACLHLAAKHGSASQVKSNKRLRQQTSSPVYGLFAGRTARAGAPG